MKQRSDDHPPPKDTRREQDEENWEHEDRGSGCNANCGWCGACSR